MKLKYYLRGLGIGILVTALIMGISAGSRKQMSDEEVKARAKELGMVENTTLSNIVNVLDKETESEKETVSGDALQNDAKDSNTDPTENGLVATESNETEPEETKPVETKPADTKPTETQPTEMSQDGNSSTPAESEDTEVLTITIRSGESSVSVSKSLAEAGLVEDASSYDKYLCSNGFDKKIVTGTYHIPKGTTNEDIAKVITGKLTFD